MTPIRMLLLLLTISLLLAACASTPRAASGSAGPPSGSRSSANALTNSKAQSAINRWVARFPGASISVVGVRELPQENAAVVDLKITNLRWTVNTPYMTLNQACPSCSGTARFSRYSDGRWILSTLETSEGGDWKDINIDAS